jgi:hypothetical protein
VFTGNLLLLLLLLLLLVRSCRDSSVSIRYGLEERGSIPRRVRELSLLRNSKPSVRPSWVSETLSLGFRVSAVHGYDNCCIRGRSNLCCAPLLNRSQPSAWSLYSLYRQFNIQQFYVLPCTVYLCVVCGSQKKQRLFPYTTITDWFL